MLGQEVRYRCIEEGCTMKQAMETTRKLRELASEVVSSHFCQIDNSATCLVAPLYGPLTPPTSLSVSLQR